MEFVNKHGGTCIGFSGFDGGEFNKLCRANIVVEKGSTPLIEGFHSEIAHMIIFRLKEMIAGAK
jgi:phosphoheptose isomerase